MAGANPDDPAVDGEAEEDEAEDEEEQIPQNLHGYWQKSRVKDSDVKAMESEGTVAPQAESRWRTDFKAPVPLPNPSEIVMLKFHVERGLSMPPSLFFTNLLKYYGLQLHHVSPNSLVSMAGYAALCEGYLGIHPRVDLFQLFFSGLTGANTIYCWISWRVQPLQYRPALMCEYSGIDDPQRYSKEELSAEEIELRIRNIIKVGRDEPLKLKIPMYENGSCPKVSASPYSTITANFP
jgi:hypothetical protein